MSKVYTTTKMHTSDLWKLYLLLLIAYFYTNANLHLNINCLQTHRTTQIIQHCDSIQKSPLIVTDGSNWINYNCKFAYSSVGTRATAQVDELMLNILNECWINLRDRPIKNDLHQEVTCFPNFKHLILLRW